MPDSEAGYPPFASFACVGIRFVRRRRVGHDVPRPIESRQAQEDHITARTPHDVPPPVAMMGLITGY